MAAAACLLAALELAPSGLPAQQNSKLVEFDAPGATTMNSKKCAPSCGTLAYASDAAGTIVGSYTDKDDVLHGFIRDRNGSFTSVDAPGAGHEHGLNEGTVAYSINDKGQISGQFEDAESVYHGFIRNPDGSFTTIDVPGAGTAPGQGTIATSINSGGATAGNYIDGTGSHGFVRSPAGKIATFDPPNSQETVVCQSSCLNQEGEVSGYYFVAGEYFYSAFLREPDGQITTFALSSPGPVVGSGTFCRSINRAGVLACNFRRHRLQGRGFLRYPNGTISDFPKSGFRTEEPQSINASGEVTGIAIDKKGEYRGFVSSPSGAIVVFNVPDAVKNRESAGTFPTTINFRGDVAGYYTDVRGLNHGFWLTP